MNDYHAQLWLIASGTICVAMALAVQTAFPIVMAAIHAGG